MVYIENPKTKGSGVLCCIPQKGICPVGCSDCFFQSGRSYLEPLDQNLPNMPSIEMAEGKVVRVNDGNDSNNQRDLVIDAVKSYKHAFFNTSMAKDIAGFGRPVVLTVNPGRMTDVRFQKVDPIPPNLMFVRFRVNTWNLEMCDEAVAYYTAGKVPVVLTFMAYYTDRLIAGHEQNYSFRKRTINSYHVINPGVWESVMNRYVGNKYVYSCGKDAATFSCSHCGNCLREYFATMERIGSK